MAAKQNYKNAISELEDILDSIENDSLEIDTLSEKIKRASKLLEYCKDKLHKTENEIINLMKAFENESNS